jgi:hypothetical protein
VDLEVGLVMLHSCTGWVTGVEFRGWNFDPFSPAKFRRSSHFDLRRYGDFQEWPDIEVRTSLSNFQSEMQIKSLRVAAYKDEFPLAITVFASTESRNDADKIVVLFNNATGVTQNFYSAFARYNSI